MIKYIFLIAAAVSGILLFSGCGIKRGIPHNADSISSLNQLSIDYLNAVRNDRNTEKLKERLFSISSEEADLVLSNDAEKMAFWINMYNASIQDILKKHPEKYEDRGKFFKEKQIRVFGQALSFADIEHGILRRSQNEYGLGYVRKLFPGRFERKMRVRQRDFRLHFALNCGAKDCPAVAVYDPKRINEQLDANTRIHLNKTSKFDSSTKTAYVTSLFSWFRGDFGGKSGTKKILREYEVVPAIGKINLQYTNYDWTLDLDNFIDL